MGGTGRQKRNHFLYIDFKEIITGQSSQLTTPQRAGADPAPSQEPLEIV